MMQIEKKSKVERLKCLYDALARAEKPTSLDEAWKLIDVELRTIEDKETTVPYDFLHYGNGKRMFLPRLSNALAWEKNGTWHIANLTSHRVIISVSGEILIIRKPSTLEFSKS